MKNNTKNVVLVGSAALVVILMLGYLFVISPLLTKMQAGRLEYQEAQASLEQAQTTAQGLEEYRSQAPAVESLNQQLERQFPSSADVSALNSQVLAAASAAGLSPSEVTSISTTTPAVMAVTTPAPAAEETTASEDGTEESTDTAEEAPAEATPQSSPVASMEVTISAEGSLDALIRFADGLNNIDRVILVTDTSINSEGEKAQLSVKGIAYLYQPIQTVSEAEASTGE